MSLKINDISVQIDRRRVLRSVTFEAGAGEITGLCGWSGSGKTSLLKAIAGLRPIENGTVSLDAAGGQSVVKRCNVQYVAAASEISRWDSLFRSTAKMNAADGAKQLIEIENALQSGKQLILLDDAACFMDGRERSRCFEAIRSETRNRHLTVLYATSDFEKILIHCDSAAILDGGEIVQVGEPQHVYESPVSKAVAELTGRNNVFEVRRLSSSKAEIPQFQSLIGGHRLFSKRAERSTLGALNQNTFLAIRPEHISISFGASFPEDNLLKARITRTHFLGPATLVSIDCGGLAVEALVPRLVGLGVGDECMVGLPPDRLRILNK